MDQNKDQLISICPFGVIDWRLDQNTDKIFSSLAPKEWPNQRNKGTFIYKLWGI